MKTVITTPQLLIRCDGCGRDLTDGSYFTFRGEREKDFCYKPNAPGELTCAQKYQQSLEAPSPLTGAYPFP